MAQVLKDEVKAKIKESAVDVFTEKGFKKASIKEIAKHADVSVGNVYRYYSDKEGLYKSVIQGVYNGVNEILRIVESRNDYELVFEGKLDDDKLFDPMIHFIQLYRQEKKVFRMLLHNGRDQHYDKTIAIFIDLLKNYFMKFWGIERRADGMTDTEASAFTNAIVFSVIDLLNHVEDDELDDSLMVFVNRMVKGYFAAKAMEVAEG